MQTLVFSRLPGLAGPDHHIALTRVERGRTTFEHNHDYPEFFLVTRGSGTHVWNGRELAIERGWLVFVRFVDRHFYRAPSDDVVEFINLAVSPGWWFHFEKLLNPPFQFRAFGAGLPPGHRRIGEEATIRVEKGLRTLLAARGPQPIMLAENIVAMMRELQDTEPFGATVEQSEFGRVPEWLATVVRDLDCPDLVCRPLSFWQKRCGRSPEHLARTCRKYFNLSPTELLNRARVRLVKDRLRMGEDKVATVAIESGFENLGYFYRVFRRFEGCSPKVWLKRESTNEAVPG